MSHHLTVRIECHSHIRSLTGRVLNDMEHLRRMKEISARQLGQLAPFRIQVYLILAHNRQLSNWSNNNLCVQNYIFSAQLQESVDAPAADHPNNTTK